MLHSKCSMCLNKQEATHGDLGEVKHAVSHGTNVCNMTVSFRQHFCWSHQLGQTCRTLRGVTYGARSWSFCCKKRVLEDCSRPLCPKTCSKTSLVWLNRLQQHVSQYTALYVSSRLSTQIQLCICGEAGLHPKLHAAQCPHMSS